MAVQIEFSKYWVGVKFGGSVCWCVGNGFGAVIIRGIGGVLYKYVGAGIDIDIGDGFGSGGGDEVKF